MGTRTVLALAAALCLLPASLLRADDTAELKALAEKGKKLNADCRFKDVVKVVHEMQGYEITNQMSSKLHGVLALAYLGLERYEQALEEAEQSVTLDSESPNNGYVLGLTLYRWDSKEKHIAQFRQGVVDSALAACRKGTSVKKKEDRALSYACTGALEAATGDSDEAVHDLLEANINSPGKPPYEDLLAQAYDGDQQPDKAAQWYEIYLKDIKPALKKNPGCVKYTSADIQTAKNRLKALESASAASPP